jgi:hypothetical protein
MSPLLGIIVIVNILPQFIKILDYIEIKYDYILVINAYAYIS